MAVAQTTETRTIIEMKETASDLIQIRRRSIKNNTTSVYDIVFSADVAYSTVLYRGNEALDRLEIIKVSDSNQFTLTPEQMNALFGTPITLDDGTKTVIGEFIANQTDALIALNVIKVTKDRIKPMIALVSTSPDHPEGVVISNASPAQQGVTWAWTCNDSHATITPIANNQVVVSGFIGRATVTCIATETASGVTSETSVEVI